MRIPNLINKLEDVKAFQEKHNWQPQSFERTKALLQEELDEYKSAKTYKDEIDACVDYLYVWLGGFLRGYICNFDYHIKELICEHHKEHISEWWVYVQKANMTKGTNGKSIVLNQKIMKGEDFKRPEHFAELAGFFERHPEFKKD